MKKYLTIALLLLISGFCSAKKGSTQNLDLLDYYISIDTLYNNQKIEKIGEIKAQISVNQGDNKKLYELYNELSEQYKSYIYDSAFFYVEKLIQLATAENDNNKLYEANTKLCFCYLSSGLFSEAFDIIKKNEKIECADQNLKIQYLLTKARLYYDIADFNNDENRKDYEQKGNEVMTVALEMIPKNTAQYYASLGLKEMKSGKYHEAIYALNKLLECPKKTEHDIAIASSSLAYIYSLLGDKVKQKELLLQAAIADIKSSTKETVALRDLAKLLKNENDITHAAEYIRKALADASFYNARHRQVEIGYILPIIEEERIKIIEEKNKNITRLLVAISFLTLLALLALAIIIRSLSKLNKAKRTIQNKSNELATTNGRLLEANKIKEEYIGYFFNLDSDYVAKIEAFQRWVNRKIAQKQYEDLNKIPPKFDAKNERDRLFSMFDSIILKIFPNFVSEFNALLSPEGQIILQQGELLNTDLRIYALMRLGIRNNEKIAQFLNYSVNTIYTYKAKIKSYSLCPSEEFKQRIMEIKSI
ncbi:MAG: DUF6377 domain-containing protein [Prevotellaceae bacterium]|jgi:hypothetical protein|nr:DUF6377 domain-containing protein [Prevotellaceae bacterium]